MSGRGPEPKELRASLVDSGWSVTPPAVDDADARASIGADLTPRDPASRRLPNYEDLSQAPAVTQVDNEIQDRLRAMQRASLVDHRPASAGPPPPPSRPSRSAPPSLPPPPPPSMPPPRPSQVPLPSFDARPAARVEVPAPSFSATPQIKSASAHTSSAEFVSADPIEVDDEPEAPLPSFAAPAPTPLETYGASPAELRMPAPPTFSLGPAAPSLLSALKQRVRFAGGELPLWSLLAPMVVLLVLGAAFVAAAFGGSEDRAASPLSSASDAPPAPSAVGSSAEVAPEPPPTAATQAPALPASSIDTEALEARRAEELTKSEALALASARRQREVARIAVLRQKLSRDPGLFQDAATLAELRRAAEDPLTAPDALSAIAEAPGPLSADLLYEMWTGTVVRNSATELARSLVFSKEVRAKASPELAIALDLRIAETCEQNKELVPRVLDKGDRRSLALLARLSRKFGCGANKRLDCYPCLRDNQLVEEAMAAVKKRREPKPFAGK